MPPARPEVTAPMNRAKCTARNSPPTTRPITAVTIDASRMPIAPAMRLRVEDLPLIDASIESANRDRAKYSCGRNSSATAASNGVASRNTIRLNIPPMTLATVAIPSARPASPRFAMG